MNVIEIAAGHVSNRGRFGDRSELSSCLEPETELYRSLFLLDEEDTRHIVSIAEYKGNFTLDSVIFDIDVADGTGHTCLNNARRFHRALIKKGVNPDAIIIWFSGRGFHIEIPNLYGFKPANDLPLTVKRTIDKHLKGLKFDNIYDRGRLIRVGFSYNEKSGLYKIPLSHDELFEASYDHICLTAEKFCCETRVKLYNSIMETVHKNNQVHIFQSKIIPEAKIKKEHIIDKPVNVEGVNGNVTCVQKMVRDPNKAGRRHNLLLRMVSAWRRLGISRTMCYGMGSTAIPSLDMEDIQDKVNYVFDKPYEYACDDVFMSEYCDPICKFYIHKDYGTDVKNAEEMWRDYVETSQTGLENTSFNLNDVWSLGKNYRFCEGELAVLIGDTKLGKTAFMQNMVIPLTHMRVLYLTLEVHMDLIIRRFIQIANGMSKSETINQALSHNSDKATEILAPLQHIYCRQSVPELNSIKELISEVHPKIVVIDTLDGINVKYSNDPFVKTEKIIMKLKEIAHQNDIIVIAISHIGKGASEEGLLDVHRAKGNSVIEQKADKILGIEGNLEGNMTRTIKSLASRDESDFKLAFMFDPTTFRFNQIKEVAHV